MFCLKTKYPPQPLGGGGGGGVCVCVCARVCMYFLIQVSGVRGSGCFQFELYMGNTVCSSYCCGKDSDWGKSLALY